MGRSIESLFNYFLLREQFVSKKFESYSTFGVYSGKGDNLRNIFYWGEGDKQRHEKGSTKI